MQMSAHRAFDARRSPVTLGSGQWDLAVSSQVTIEHCWTPIPSSLLQVVQGIASPQGMPVANDVHFWALARPSLSYVIVSCYRDIV